MKPLPDKNDKGEYLMTESFCKKISEYNGYTGIPQFISTLHLHFKAFKTIENLGSFVNIKVLYLENNLITKIENLSHMVNLQCLYLNSNFIENIENLYCNTNLRILNLTHNKIKYIPKLSLPLLDTLSLEENLIENIEGIENVQTLQSLNVLGLSSNYIDDEDKNYEPLFKILGGTNVKVLYFKGNPLIRSIQNYRKRMVKELENLTYLDEKPVDEGERLAVNAFWEGGLELERKVKNEYRLKRDFGNRVKKTNTYNNFNQTQTEGGKDSKEERRGSFCKQELSPEAKRKEFLSKKKRELLNRFTQSGCTDERNEISNEIITVNQEIKDLDKLIVIDEFSVFYKKDSVVEKYDNNKVSEKAKEEDYKERFLFEEWMSKECEYFLFMNMWDIRGAFQSFTNKYKNRIQNIESLTEKEFKLFLSICENEYGKQTVNFEELD